ncbi:MAG: hypothetical protein PHE51_04850 [Eubacteriales bacterium]|nr:hypothetical protein [Eubacteriales bacterium]
MPRGNPDKLIPNTKRSPEEVRENGKKGGIKSGIVRKEKKLMSQIFAEFLDKDHDIIGKDGIKKKLSGQQLVNSVMSKVLSRGDSASVSLLKVIAEATEGSKVNVEGHVDTIINVIGIKPKE